MESARETASELQEFLSRLRRAVRRKPPFGAGEEYRSWLAECRRILCGWCDAVRREPVLSEQFLQAARLHKSVKVTRLLGELSGGIRSACSTVRRHLSGELSEKEAMDLEVAERAAEQLSGFSQNDVDAGCLEAKPPAPWPSGIGQIERKLQRVEDVSSAHGGLGGTPFADAVRRARAAIRELNAIRYERLEGKRHRAAYYLLATYHGFAVTPFPEFGANVDDWPRVREWFRKNADDGAFVTAPGAEYPGRFELHLAELLTDWLIRPEDELRRGQPDAREVLSRRERAEAILAGADRQVSLREIAEALGIAVRTLRHWRRQLRGARDAIRTLYPQFLEAVPPRERSEPPKYSLHAAVRLLLESGYLDD